MYIREPVNWMHHGDKATNKATALVAAAITKARELEPLTPVRVEANPHATVIGAGVTGLRAALDLSREVCRCPLWKRRHALAAEPPS